MSPRVDRWNRGLLAALGLVAAAAGTLTLLRGYGRAGWGTRDDRLVTDGLAGDLHRQRTLLLLATAVVALLVLFASLRWLVSQLARFDHAPYDAKMASSGLLPWAAVIEAGAVERFLEETVGQFDDVDRVSARFSAAQGDEPLIELRVWARDEADLGSLRQAIDTGPFGQVALLLGLADPAPPLRAQVTFELVDRPALLR